MAPKLVVAIATAAASLLLAADAFHAPARALARPTTARFVFGGNDPDGNKPLTREDEPDEYFASSFESMAPEEKLKDPLVIIGLVSIFFPFILLVFFQATGVI